VDPVRGSDTYPGTATQPFQTVRYALTTDVVSSAANTIGSGTDGGTDVTVTIVRAETEVVSSNINNISTPTLDRGSVTVVGPSGFNFNLNNRPLILNKGYRLQGFKIKSGDPGGSSGSNAKAAAITLNAEGTPLKDMVIDCTGITTSGASAVGQGDKCVHVTSSGTVTLENVRIAIPSNQSYVTGILYGGSGTLSTLSGTLRVTNGSSVVAVRSGSGNPKGVVGIYGNTAFGSVEVVGSTVSLSEITAQGGNVFAVLLSPIDSGRVERSSIQVREGSSASEIAIGVCVNASGTVNVQGNTFTNTNVPPPPSASTSIAIYKQAGTVVQTGNTFIGFSTSSPDNRYAENRPGLSCP